MDNTQWRIPNLSSAGLMMSYRCSNACKHCAYRCSPKMPDEWITLEMAERILDGLAAEPYFSGLHFAGGEATMKMDLLVELIRMACRKGVPIEYLETNAYSCRDYDKSVAHFTRLRDAGLPCVMISVSMYHNEFIPLRNTKTAIAAVQEVFGAGGYFVYPGHLLRVLSQLPDDGRYTLEEFCSNFGISVNDRELHNLFPLLPLGRVPEALRGMYDKYPAEHFAEDACATKLQSSHHAHVDLYGNLFTGSCCGISPGTVDDFHPTISEDRYPIFSSLCTGGPCSLLPMAEAHGFEHSHDGYISKCDLCFRVRKHLHQTGDFVELQPSCFYTTE